MSDGLTPLAYWAGLALCAFGGTLVVLGETRGLGGPFRSNAAAYWSYVETRLRFIRARTTTTTFIALQVLFASGLGIAALALGQPLFLVAAVVVPAAPLLLLERRRRKRVEALEEQLAGWLTLLANALHGTPSLVDAIGESGKLSGPPMRDEIELIEKEVRFGTALDTALDYAADRIDSPTVRSALASLVVARQTGGDLSEMLERSAEALRELTRLDGILVAKTAEVRSQAYLLSAIPFVLVGALHAIDPAWLDPLSATPLGWAITGTATALWVAAMLFARRILAVEM